MNNVTFGKYPFIFSEAKKYRIRRHVAFWTFWWLFQGFLYSFIAAGTPELYWLRLQSSICEAFIYLIPHMLLSYSLMYFVLPKYLLQGRYWATTACTIALCLLTAAVSVLVSFTLIKQIRLAILPAVYVTGSRSHPNTVNAFLALMAGLRGAITIGGFAASIKLMKHWYVKEQRNLQLQKENVEAQLQLLKAQVHPHFLFNTLNNIYSYTQHAAPVAAKLVTGLADMLRYMLYEGSQAFVPLDKELKMLQDYIGLETIRYGNKLDVNVELPEKTNLLIAPLLLVPLVENCFKHGASHFIDHPWVSLHAEVEAEHILLIKLLNGKTEEPHIEHTTAKGIGIQNVRRRLELLYPQRHELHIINEPDVFIVNLRLVLDVQQQAPTETTTHKQPAYA